MYLNILMDFGLYANKNKEYYYVLKLRDLAKNLSAQLTNFSDSSENSSLPTRHKYAPKSKVRSGIISCPRRLLVQSERCHCTLGAYYHAAQTTRTTLQERGLKQYAIHSAHTHVRSSKFIRAGCVCAQPSR